MEKIKKNDVKNEIERLKELKRENIKEFYTKIQNQGYKLTTLSSSSKYFLLEGEIQDMTITSKKFLNGRYLVVGALPTTYQGYKFSKSMGYVKEIE